MKQNPTQMIKSHFSNQVHELLNPNPCKNSDHKQRTANFKVKDAMTVEQKAELYDQIVKLDHQCTFALGSYRFQRREIRRRDKARIARGWATKDKKKLSPEEVSQYIFAKHG